MSEKIKTKLVHLPSSVGGNPQGLSKAFRELGVDSQCWVFGEDKFNYGNSYFIYKTTDSRFLKELKRLFALRYAFKFETVFFNYGSTLFQPPPAAVNINGWKQKLYGVYKYYCLILQRIELSILKARSVKIIIQYQGDDARQGDFCRKNFQVTAATRVNSSYYNSESDASKRKQIGLLCELADHVFALNPDLLYVLPSKAKFLPYSHMDLINLKTKPISERQGKITIGHAPSHREVKGTDLLMRIIENLQKEGMDFEFVLIENLPHAEAIEKFKEIDILIDQLLIGWYGGLSVECMALSKVVLCYLREEDLKFIPQEMKNEIPIINVNESNLEQKLRILLSYSREELSDLGTLSRNFALKWHEPQRVAKTFLRDVVLN